MVVLAMLMSAPALAENPWVALGTRSGVAVFKRDEGSTLFAFRGEGEVPVHIGKLVAVQRDPEMARDWVDLLERVEHQMVSETAAHVYMHYDMSWPIQDRDFLVLRDVEINSTAKTYKVTLQSIEDARWPADPCCVRATIHRTTWEFTALPGGNTRVEVEVLTDPGGAIPHWLANAVQRDWPVNSIQGLVTRAVQPDVEPEPDLLDW